MHQNLFEKKSAFRLVERDKAILEFFNIEKRAATQTGVISKGQNLLIVWRWMVVVRDGTTVQLCARIKNSKEYPGTFNFSDFNAQAMGVQIGGIKGSLITVHPSENAEKIRPLALMKKNGAFPVACQPRNFQGIIKLPSVIAKNSKKESLGVFGKKFGLGAKQFYDLPVFGAAVPNDKRKRAARDLR